MFEEDDDEFYEFGSRSGCSPFREVRHEGRIQKQMPCTASARNVRSLAVSLTRLVMRPLFREGSMVADIVRTWVAGWAVSRRTPPPVDMPWGFYIEVADNPAERGRHVLPEVDEALVRSAAASVEAPRTWMKIPAEPAEIEPWLPQGWAWEESGHLMAVDLVASNPVAPEGYTVTVEAIGAVAYVRVWDATGEPAAQGQMALLGEATVVDRVVTEEAHRRRGLGNFVMRTLADHAVDQGAVLGVLGATDAGRALYETLGWKKHATLAECVYRP
ncbi:GNAT family N-acetyltransferase [Streptomyces sp. WZ-12]|uniref:GNAT family N-acetyltransferase n=1 Tax=Streptomyces sp. WZ-12 TaxID=3030210 RepID=UPI0023816DA2|nr:GNAT family N-acetyltransferase [Streptomyces sp. WZ-12]